MVWIQICIWIQTLFELEIEKIRNRKKKKGKTQNPAKPQTPAQTATQIEPRNTPIAISGEFPVPRRHGEWSPAVSAAAPRPMALVRRIYNKRSGLDPDPDHLEPSDLDPTDQIQTYRFSPALLLKSPPTSLK